MESVAQLLQLIPKYNALPALLRTFLPILASCVLIFALLAIAVLFSAVRLRPGVAALLGFLVGAMVDSLLPTSFGAAALSFTLIGYAASWLKAVFFADHIALTGLFVFGGKWLYDAIYLISGPRVGGIDLVVQLLLWTPLSAALTAGVAVLLLTLFRPLYRPQTK